MYQSHSDSVLSLITSAVYYRSRREKSALNRERNVRKLKRRMGLLRPANKNVDRRAENMFTKTIYIEMTPEIHHQIKAMAHEHNITIRKWATRVLIKGLNRELDTQ